MILGLLVYSSMAISLPTFPATHWPPLPSGDLDARVQRAGTDSRKFDGPSTGKWTDGDVLGMWIADMDFRSPQPIVDAIVSRAQHGVYGYTDCSPELAEGLCSRLKTVYSCAVEPSDSWFRWLPGLIPGLNHAVRATCNGASDTVAIATPIYAPFLLSPTNCGAMLRTVPLVESRVSSEVSSEIRYDIDWAALEATLADPATKLLHWCNPHNPVGRCWTRLELVRVARLCVTHEVTLCSDEVWGEMPLDEAEHPFISMLSLLTDDDDTRGSSTDDPAAASGVCGLRSRLIVLLSPSKCFNVATLDLAVAVVPDETLLGRMRLHGRDAAEASGCDGTRCARALPPALPLAPPRDTSPTRSPQRPLPPSQWQVTCFGYAAATAAYTSPECEVWRHRLIAYLRANRDYACAALDAMNGVRWVRPESSYLLWIDAADALPPGTDAETFFREAGVALTGGVPFGGPPGSCRLNFGCRRETLEEALRRMATAIDAARS